MRILVATDQWFPDVRGGAARVAQQTARRLASRGHDVTVLAPASRNARAPDAEEGVLVLRRLPRSWLPQTISDTVASWWNGRGLSGPFDLVVAHQSTLAAGLASAYRRLPLVFVYHASAVREARLRARSDPRAPARVSDTALALLLGELERRVVRRARSVVVLSEYSRSLVTGDHPEVRERVVLAPGGVDTQEFSPGQGRDAARAALGIRADEPLLVSMRRLEPELGLETLVRAFGRLTPDAARLVIVGDGRLAPRLRRLGDELGIGPRLELVGSRSEGELQEWYRAADLFVLSPAPHEGFGLATIEALASGTPVVAAAVGANPELLAPFEPRLLAPTADPVDIAEAISRGLALADAGLRRRCREYAASRFAWDRVIPVWENVLLHAAKPLRHPSG